MLTVGGAAGITTVAGCSGSGGDSNGGGDSASTDESVAESTDAPTTQSESTETEVQSEVFDSIGFEGMVLSVQLVEGTDVDTVNLVSSEGEALDSTSVTAGSSRVGFEMEGTVRGEYDVVAVANEEPVETVSRSFAPDVRFVDAVSGAVRQDVSTSAIEVDSDRTKSQITEEEGSFYELSLGLSNEGNSPVVLQEVGDVAGAFALALSGVPKPASEPESPEEEPSPMFSKIIPPGETLNLPVVGQDANPLEIKYVDGEPFDEVAQFLDDGQQFPDDYFNGEERECEFYCADTTGEVLPFTTSLRYSGGAVVVGSAGSFDSGTAWAPSRVESVD